MLRCHGRLPGVCSVNCGPPVPVDPVMPLQPLIKTHLLQCHGASEAHGGIVNGAVQIVRRLRRRGEYTDAEAPGLQILFYP